MGTFTGNNVSSGSIIYAADHNTLIALLAALLNGGVDTNNLSPTAGILGSQLANLTIDLGAKASIWDGWVGVSDSWAYASATTITIPSDGTTKYSVGDKIKLVQSATTKYFYVTAVAATLLTVTGGSDYTVANSAITGVYYSKVSSPVGFPQCFNYTAVYTGFSASPTSTNRFNIQGRICTVTIYPTGNGTSNASGFTITAPVTATNSALMLWWGNNKHVDNGTASTSAGTQSITNNTGVINVYQDSNNQGWTTSAAKSAAFTLIYEI